MFTIEDLKVFRERLVAMRDELEDKGPVKLEPNRTDPESSRRDEDGQPLNEMHQTIASRRNVTRIGARNDILGAIARIDDWPEDFGLCESCEEPIPRRRLELMPYARLCVACQSAQEPDRGVARRKITDFR